MDLQPTQKISEATDTKSSYDFNLDAYRGLADQRRRASL
jgi:hypothetical protein